MSSNGAGADTSSVERDLDRQMSTVERLVGGLGRVIHGKEEFLRRFIAGLAAGGHVLIEDMPGLGKTTVAKTLARLIGVQEHIDPESVRRAVDAAALASVPFRRIQFTPDLLPYDITGVDVFDPETRRFTFSPGPVFTSVLLADEINRTTPKVQSALLEVMAEGQVTVGNTTHELDPLFFVMATQNPIETEGTYPLPVAQLDRFMMRLALGYPDEQSEYRILTEDPSETVMPGLGPVCGRGDVLALRRAVRAVHCEPSLVQAIVSVCDRTRKRPELLCGVSPRGGLMLLHASRAYALVRGRSYVIDQDVLDLAPSVLAHRIAVRDPSTDAIALVEELASEQIEAVAHAAER